MRRVTSARHSIWFRGLQTTIQSMFLMPFSFASSGLISANISGISSLSHPIQRDIEPEVYCSVTRYVVTTYGYSGSLGGLMGLSFLENRLATGLSCRAYSAFFTGDSSGS